LDTEKGRSRSKPNPQFAEQHGPIQPYCSVVIVARVTNELWWTMISKSQHRRRRALRGPSGGDADKSHKCTRLSLPGGHRLAQRL